MTAADGKALSIATHGLGELRQPSVPTAFGAEEPALHPAASTQCLMCTAG